MDWKEKILSAMLEIQSACRMNGEWSECHNCPFNTYCTVLITETGLEPSERGVEKE